MESAILSGGHHQIYDHVDIRTAQNMYNIQVTPNSPPQEVPIHPQTTHDLPRVPFPTSSVSNTQSRSPFRRLASRFLPLAWSSRGSGVDLVSVSPSLETFASSASWDDLTTPDLYIRCLLPSRKGYPLYNTQPRGDFVGECGIVPGDVGSLDSTAGYEGFFNLFSTNWWGSGENPLPPLATSTIPDVIQDEHAIFSGTSLTRIPATDGSIDCFQFRCEARKGAALVLTSSADLERFRDHLSLKDSLIRHFEDIYRAANGEFESLVVVTGCTKSHGCATASFLEKSNNPSNQILRLKRRSTNPESISKPPIFDWHDQAMAEVQRFPDPTRASSQNQHKNQSLFIYGYKMSFHPAFRTQMKDKPHPGKPTGADGKGADSSGSSKGRGNEDSPPGQPGNEQTGRDTHWRGETGGRQGRHLGGGSTEEVYVESFPSCGTSSLCHPCDILNQYLLEKTQADCAITHDDDWLDLDFRGKADGDLSWIVEEVMSRSIIQIRNGVAILERKSMETSQGRDSEQQRSATELSSEDYPSSLLVYLSEPGTSEQQPMFPALLSDSGSSEETPYRGLKRRLVLAFDVGTTFSGVSYCVLDPGSVPEIKGVTRFPAHEQVSGASKIPTVLYYDKAGKVRAVGAEALQQGIFEQAEENGWIKTEWFKLHIRPREGASSSEVASKIPPLPLNKTVIDVLADYLAYLFKCAQSYICDTHANGPDLWDSVKNEIEFVLSHPNGWEGFQQTQIRQAVVKAKLIREGQGDRVSFISEGEASLWFALKHGLPEGTMERGEGVVIVDAGGGTIDISTYQKPVGGEKFEEISAPKCHFYGSIFVSIHARLFFQNLLKESEYLDDLDHIVRCFDMTTKTRFADNTVTQYVKFGSTKDRDEEVGIRRGQLKLSGADVATFFEPSVKCIVGTVEEMLRMGTHHITHVVLVGGFGASDWLFKQLQKELGSQGLKVVRPELYVNKAVSDGAVAFHLSSQVQARIAKYSYGTLQNVEFIPSDPDHKHRASHVLTRPSGRRLVPGGFVAMLKKGTRASDDNEVKTYFWREVDSKTQLTNVAFDVYCYEGQLDNPKFFDMDPNHFRKLWSIEVDLSHLPLTPQTRKGGAGVYYTVKYWVVLKFGFDSPELKAQMLWNENGVERRSPATLVFYHDS